MIGKHICRFCKDYTKIENYDEAIADNTQAWDCHHRLETHFSDGEKRPANAAISKLELIALDMYFDRPAEELIFLRRKDHVNIHKEFRSYKHTEEAKRNISEALKGRSLSMETRQLLSKIRRGKPKSEEFKARVSATLKGKPKHRCKPACNKGMHRYTNGIVKIYAFECPEGFRKGWK